MRVKLLPKQTIYNKPPPSQLSNVPQSPPDQEPFVPLRVLPRNKSKQKKSAKSIEPYIKLKHLLQNSDHVLCKVKSLFPFDFFPDELSVEPTQITVIIRGFFLSENVFSIPIKNVSDVLLETSPFFATLKIIDRSFSDNEISIRFLKKDEAIKARRIIQGLVLAATEEIDLSHVSHKTLLDHAERLGKAHGYE